MKPQRMYRIEGRRAVPIADGEAVERHLEIMSALSVIKESLAPAREVSASLIEEHRRDMQEALRLKVELDSISEAIQRTKLEIATLHYAGAKGQEMARVTDELGAIVMGTETATNTILASAERIEELAGNLAARLAGGDKDYVREISDHVISIFEACNFQDITGQRIEKVVTAMRFVEERVGQMIQIWGGLESFKDVPMLEAPDRVGDKALLNGPSLATDAGVTSQDAIDALFN
ncbi:protein phosphatase CheZ [Microvirga massiliensis]|uniref:protein phosphatase CheZ n=1 Tax=Microvirga massiliensis TaxID=1033741 RepID=UPI0009E65336|nr:protein phosphatase CheZ [Microvirga massiliensis]